MKEVIRGRAQPGSRARRRCVRIGGCPGVFEEFSRLGLALECFQNAFIALQQGELRLLGYPIALGKRFEKCRNSLSQLSIPEALREF